MQAIIRKILINIKENPNLYIKSNIKEIFLKTNKIKTLKCLFKILEKYF
jgi:hypothetical protein